MNKMYFMGVILSLALLLTACHRESLDKKTCQTLLFKTFKGFPFESKRFKSNCLDHDLDYTLETCKKALNEMVMGKGKADLQIKFGDQILNCFSKNDKKKFLIK